MHKITNKSENGWAWSDGEKFTSRNSAEGQYQLIKSRWNSSLFDNETEFVTTCSVTFSLMNKNCTKQMKGRRSTTYIAKKLYGNLLFLKQTLFLFVKGYGCRIKGDKELTELFRLVLFEVPMPLHTLQAASTR